MSADKTRRRFLADVGRGTLIAAIGSMRRPTSVWHGRRPTSLGQGRLTFGPLERLVALMQETPAERIVPTVIDEWQRGTDLLRLVAGAVLANARTFGGEDYVGFHTMMALGAGVSSQRRATEGPATPADHQGSSTAMPAEFKNAAAAAMRSSSAVEPESLASGLSGGEALQRKRRGKDMIAAEHTFESSPGRTRCRPGI